MARGPGMMTWGPGRSSGGRRQRRIRSPPGSSLLGRRGDGEAEARERDRRTRSRSRWEEEEVTRGLKVLEGGGTRPGAPRPHRRVFTVCGGEVCLIPLGKAERPDPGVPMPSLSCGIRSAAWLLMPPKPSSSLSQDVSVCVCVTRKA